MLKQTVTYKDFNDEEQTETLYFNISMTEVVDVLDIGPRLEAWRNRTAGDKRDLNVPEIQEMLNILKDLVAASYGERSEDGKRFRKSPAIFDDFKSSGAYDAFMIGMFRDAEKAITFMSEVLPSELLTDEQMKQAIAEARATTQTPDISTVKDLNATKTEVPAWMREDRDPTPKELQSMSQEELRAAYEHKTKKSSSEHIA